jgi:hypothetical protein
MIDSLSIQLNVAILLASRSFLTGHRSPYTSLGASIGPSTLTVYRQITSMSQTAVTTNLLQPLDIQAQLTSQITFYNVFTIDYLAQADNFFISQIFDPDIRINSGSL